MAADDVGRGADAPIDMHAGQLSPDVGTVRALVDAQFPQWRELAVTALRSSGTVNALFRLGDELVARLPLEPGQPADVRRTLEREAGAAARLAGRTNVATPRPVALGDAGVDYPLPWAVQTWVPGEPATPDHPASSHEFARDLAAFVADVRAIDTGGARFTGAGRGGRLTDHDSWLATCFARSADLLDVAPLRTLWERWRELPPSAGGDVMTHGDLIPGNVLVRGDRLAGVIDVGGLGPADPALDLVAAWHMLDPGPRRTLRDALRVDDVQWARGAAWALQQAMGLVWYYVDSNPAASALGRRTLARLLADPPVA